MCAAFTTIKFQCPQCGQKLEADSDMFGNMNKCPVCHVDFKVPDSRLSTGIHIGNFILKKRIGMGGMGEVWLAEQQTMGRQVALKIVKEQFNDNPSFQKRFAREIQNSGKLNHPNIATAYFAGEDNNIQYMAMEYIDGHTLDSRIRLGPLSEEKALSIIKAVSTGLDYAWKNFKMIHRDIKPSNIMISDNDNVKILDMGIARSMQEVLSTTLATTTGEVMGTPHYMSPEQAQGQKDIDCRTDMYSLGIVLHEMLTGKLPFDAPSPVEVVAQHIFAPRPDLHVSHKISERTAAIARKMIESDREKRFTDFQELLAAISDPGKTIQQQPTPQEPDRRPGWKTITAAAFLVLLAIILALPLITRQPRTNTDGQQNKKSTPSSGGGPLRQLGLSQDQIDQTKTIMEKMHRRLEKLRKTASENKDAKIRKFYYLKEMGKIHKETLQELKNIMSQEQFEEFRKRHMPMLKDNGQ